jgi:hypothetical protein
MKIVWNAMVLLEELVVLVLVPVLVPHLRPREKGFVLFHEELEIYLA